MRKLTVAYFQFLMLSLTIAVPGLGQRISFLSEDQISITGSSGDVSFTQTDVVGHIVLSATSSGLLILDASDLDNVRLMSRYTVQTDSVSSQQGNAVIAALENYAYFSQDGTCISVLDISEPTAPVKIGQLESRLPIEFMRMQGNMLLMGENLDNGRRLMIEVVDLSAPAVPSIVVRQEITDMPWGGTLHPSFIRDGIIVDTYLYILARHVSDIGHDLGRIYVYDISNPNHPTELHVYEEQSRDVLFSSIAVKDHYAFVFATYNTISVFDISNPNVLSVITQFPKGESSAGFLAVNEDRLYVNGFYDIEVYDIRKPSAPQALFSKRAYAYGVRKDLDFVGKNGVATFDYDGLWNFGSAETDSGTSIFSNPVAVDLVVEQQHAFLACKFGGIIRYDVSDPVQPHLLQRANTDGNARDIAFYQNHVYVCDDWGDIDVFNVSDPAHMFQKEYESGYINNYSLMIRENHAYVSAYRGFYILDLQQPWFPVKTGAVSSSYLHRMVLVTDKYAFVKSNISVMVFDVSDIQHPAYVGQIQGENHNDWVGFGHTFYCTNNDSLLIVYDITEPLTPKAYPTENIRFRPIIDAYVVDSLMFLSDGDIHVLNVKNPLRPTHMTSYKTNGKTGMIDVQYPNIFCADKDFFRIYRFDLTAQRGDVNSDGSVNILDVIRVVNVILDIGDPMSESEKWAADCNGDANISVLDVFGIVDVILDCGECEPSSSNSDTPLN